MMKKLLRKEFSLCLHASVLIYMLFSFCVFIPNYTYEVAFFFSAMSAFFICLKARETGDTEYTCTLPVKRSSVPVARVLFCVIMQCISVAIVAVCILIKELALSAEDMVNAAGNAANIALLGWGFIILGVFDIVFFPLYYRRTDKVGVPFVIAAIAAFAVIGLLLAFRHVLPAFDALNTPDPEYIGAKLGVFFGGMVFYAGSTVASCFVSSKLFCGGI